MHNTAGDTPVLFIAQSGISSVLVELWPCPKKCILKGMEGNLDRTRAKTSVAQQEGRSLARSLVNEKAKWRDESERPNRAERRRLESSYLRAQFGSENDPMRVKIEIKSSFNILQMAHFYSLNRYNRENFKFHELGFKSLLFCWLLYCANSRETDRIYSGMPQQLRFFSR